MNRRQLLAATGTLPVLTGCLGSVPFSDQTTGEPALTTDVPSVEKLKADCSAPDDDVPTDEAESLTPDISVGVDTPAEGVHLDIEIRHEFTADHPAQIRVIIGNNAPTERTFAYGPRPLSHGEHSDRDARLLNDWESLEHYSSPDPDGCWQAEAAIGGEPMEERVELDPGETVTEEYVLVAPHEADPCLPHGVYLFSSSLDVIEDGESVAQPSLNWGICLD
ncbi:hypothetical protein G6M89_18045 [Natronolimnobius sp. AArcel1]|uniref:hypothetical protein n=1 Tax=Natronolimnobius sp. AArcel1 TaxID=1679093 RepID=UPI0013EA8239|nr:hypothetical protein [Natronolimnobius sp. AArcel1]NGM70879.1 hypothetical protein [Natronolimnobius sp. AArcel1]